MRKFLLSAAVVSLGWMLTHAQPPEGGRPPREGRGEGRDGRPGMRGEARVDPAVTAWVKILVDKITDPHDEIRDSARAALVAVGRPALATLQPIVTGSDGAKATAARKLVDAIEATQQRTPPVTARANDRPPGAPGVNPFEAIIDELGVNDKQRQKIEEIHESLRRKNDELRQEVADGKLERDDAREKRHALHEDMFKELKEILTPEQFTKFEEAFKNAAKPPRPE